jgi:hypothetical protein
MMELNALTQEIRGHREFIKGEPKELKEFDCEHLLLYTNHNIVLIVFLALHSSLGPR